MGTIRLRLLLVSLAVSFAAIFAVAALNYVKYRNTTLDLVKERVHVVVGQVAKTFTDSRANNDADRSRALYESIASVMSADNLILQVSVFDPDGKTIASSSSSSTPEQMTDSMVRRARAATLGTWSDEEGRLLIVGQELKGAFSQHLGHVVVHYSRADLDVQFAHTARDIFRLGLACFAFAALLIPVALHFVTRRIERDLGALEVATIQIDNPLITPNLGSSPVALEVIALRSTLQAAQADLAAIAAAVDGLK